MLFLAAVQKQSKTNLFFFRFCLLERFWSASADETITWIFFCFLFNK